MQLINFLQQKFKQTFQVRPFQLNYWEIVSFHIIEVLNNLKSLFFELLYEEIFGIFKSQLSSNRCSRCLYISLNFAWFKLIISKIASVIGTFCCNSTTICFSGNLLCFRMGLKSGIDSSIEPALELVKTCGRMKFLRPVYVSLYENESSRQRAIDTFLSMKQYMSPISADWVAIDLKLKSEQA